MKISFLLKSLLITVTVQTLWALSCDDEPDPLTQSTTFYICSEESIIVNDSLGEPFSVTSPQSCAIHCVANTTCESFHIKSVVNGMECQLGTAISDFSSVVHYPESWTYKEAYPDSEVKCVKFMTPINATSPYPYPSELKTFDCISKEILCDTETDNGGWYIIQRRFSGDTDFYRGWEDYKNGFGSLDNDFWIGLETIYRLTSNGTYELRIELEYSGSSKFAVYFNFSLGNESDNYAISYGAYSGTAGDSLGTKHQGLPFTTKDRKNDLSDGNCAQKWFGAWWYENCHDSNLNGVWGQLENYGPRWMTFTGKNPANFTEMKIRRVV